MEKIDQKSVECLNCGEKVNGLYCNSCGQKIIDHRDRSIVRLAGDFLGNLFFLDNRFYTSFKILLGRPGTMTVEFLDGKRRKYLPPISLFLFINLLYFFFSPLTDYSLPLYDQIYHQPYSEVTKKWVEKKIESRDTQFTQYEEKYNTATNDISKTIMILNIPLIALLVYVFSFRKRGFYFDSFIFSIHFFSFFLLSIIVGDLIDTHTNIFSMISYDKIWFIIFLFIIPLTYLAISYKKFTQFRWWLVIMVSPILYAAILLSQLIYRFFVFLFTFLAT